MLNYMKVIEPQKQLFCSSVIALFIYEIDYVS